MNLLEQLDEVFRETIDESDVQIRKMKFDEFTNRMEAQIARLPHEEQRGAMEPVMQQMATYAGLMQHDKEDLRVRLGLRGPKAAIERLAQVATEGPSTIDLMPQVDAFWRENLGRGSSVEKRYIEFLDRLKGQVSHLPKAEQDALLWRVQMRTQEYNELAARDLPTLKAKLGLPVSPTSPSVNNNRLVQVAAETVVRATIWESIIALFRAFR
ncbi:hypothetical protein KUL72_23750 [Bradyrhizobium arachidis]|uniref:hypothetical protein n=1 Tax=Bradyrhizobium arachidis TaxID=858423 RepID=UPI00216323E3|nr:hypothetical protein [Bradyrhizobium arachidis]UVO34495.1 hypothetical protein KUL72_23750 [Bradyrhizobium arachidis]